jgi:hypothetical protein
VRLSPLGTAATTDQLYLPQMMYDGDCRAIDGMNTGRGNRSTRRKPAAATNSLGFSAVVKNGQTSLIPNMSSWHGSWLHKGTTLRITTIQAASSNRLQSTGNWSTWSTRHVDTVNAGAGDLGELKEKHENVNMSLSFKIAFWRVWWENKDERDTLHYIQAADMWLGGLPDILCCNILWYGQQADDKAVSVLLTLYRTWFNSLPGWREWMPLQLITPLQHWSPFQRNTLSRARRNTRLISDTCSTTLHGYLIEIHRFSVSEFVALTKKTKTHNTERRSILSAANTSQGCQSTVEINIAMLSQNWFILHTILRTLTKTFGGGIGMVNRLFSSPQRPERLWGSYPTGTAGSLAGRIKRPRFEAGHSPPSSAQWWNYTSTPTYLFMAWCSIN